MELVSVEYSMVIKKQYVNPPIPVRSSDWCAYPEDCEEYGPYGWGSTEAEAISDLKDQLDEQ